MYLVSLVFISVLWFMSVTTTFYFVDLNFGKGTEGVARCTGPTECAFGVI